MESRIDSYSEMKNEHYNLNWRNTVNQLQFPVKREMFRFLAHVSLQHERNI